MADRVQGSTVSQLSPQPPGVPLFKRVHGDESEGVEWVWPGWLARGHLHLVTGGAGVGKGTGIASIAKHLALGQLPAEASQRHKCGKIFLHNREDKLTTIVLPRLKAAGLSGQQIYDHFIFGEDIADKMPESLTEQLRHEKDLVAIIYNDLGEGMPLDADPNNAKDVQLFLRGVAKMAQELNVPVLGARHPRKNTKALIKEGDLTGSTLGSVQWIGVPDSCWMVLEDENCPNRSRVLFRIKCNLPCDWANGGYRMIGQPRKPLGKGKNGIPMYASCIDRWEKLTASKDAIAQSCMAVVAPSQDKGGLACRAKIIELLGHGPLPATKCNELVRADAKTTQQTVNNAFSKLVSEGKATSRVPTDAEKKQHPRAAKMWELTQPAGLFNTP